MPQSAEKLNIESEHSMSAPASPLRPGTRQELSGFEKIKRRVSENYGRAQLRVASSRSAMSARSSELRNRIMREMNKMRAQQPLLVVGLAAGVAFALGMTLRIWRSKAQ